MKVHIERFISIIMFLKKHSYVSSDNYSTKDNMTFAHDDKKTKFDIMEPEPDFLEYYNNIPKELNENIIIIYKILGNINREIYLDEWCFLSIKESLNRYEFYKTNNQTKLYDIAYKYNGMGHVIILCCDLENHLLFYRNDGGGDDNEREYNLNQAINYKREYRVDSKNNKRRRVNNLQYQSVDYFPFKNFMNEIRR